jgi:hypothetical protein
MLAGGLEPDDWHNRSYLLPAERGWLAPSILTSSGMTVTRDQTTYSIKVFSGKFILPTRKLFWNCEHNMRQKWGTSNQPNSNMMYGEIS